MTRIQGASTIDYSFFLSLSVYVVKPLNLKVAFVSLQISYALPFFFFCVCLTDRWKTLQFSLPTMSKPDANGISQEIILVNAAVRVLKAAGMVTPPVLTHQAGLYRTQVNFGERQWAVINLIR